MPEHRHYWLPVSEPVSFHPVDPEFDAIVGVYPAPITVICECGAVERQ